MGDTVIRNRLRPGIGNCPYLFSTTVDFEFEYVLNEQTEGVLTDALINFWVWRLIQT